MKEESLGIPDSSFLYLTLEDEKSRLEEYFITREFLIQNVGKFGIVPSSLKFINWGNTELVFVGKNKLDQLKTILVGQPTISYGQIKKEVDNLRYLSKNNPKDIVIPEEYYGDEGVKKEMFVAPYCYQARCISCTDNWGQYVPEPSYHFEEFDFQKRKVINSSMIAKLISMYNSKDNMGLASVELAGGDFILLKELDAQNLSYHNVLKNMKLIAARKLVKMPLDKYIARITEEFSAIPKVIGKNKDGEVIVDDSNNIINKRTNLSLSMEEITEGISIGIKLRQKNKDDEER